MAFTPPKANVTWLALAVGQDGSDGDTDPDQIPLAGVRVRLTPSPRKVEVAAAGGEPARTVTLREWQLITDATGKLINPDSPAAPIAIVASDAFTGAAVEWTSTISAPDSGVPDIAKRWSAPAGTTVDLSTVASIPPAPSPLSDYLAAVAEARSARDVSIAAADRAETAQHWAETARTGAEAARDTATGAASTATGAASTATTQAGLAATAKTGAETARTGAETAAALVSGRAYWGPRRPDILARFGTSPEEVAAKAWIQAATSGATYTSTTGPEGAWVWRKRGSTWVCVEGDTGWVDYSGRLAPEFRAANNELCRIRRTGNRVEVQISISPSGDSVPAGRAILASQLVGFGGGPIYPPPGYGGVIFHTLNGLWMLASPLVGANRGVFTWTTDDAWPTTLTI